MKINLDEIFDYTSFNIDRDPHIMLDETICQQCDQRACTNCCPAACYTWDEENKKMTFVHDVEPVMSSVRKTLLPVGAIRAEASVSPSG